MLFPASQKPSSRQTAVITRVSRRSQAALRGYPT